MGATSTSWSVIDMEREYSAAAACPSLGPGGDAAAGATHGGLFISPCPSFERSGSASHAGEAGPSGLPWGSAHEPHGPPAPHLPKHLAGAAVLAVGVVGELVRGIKEPKA